MLSSLRKALFSGIKAIKTFLTNNYYFIENVRLNEISIHDTYQTNV